MEEYISTQARMVIDSQWLDRYVHQVIKHNRVSYRCFDHIILFIWYYIKTYNNSILLSSTEYPLYKQGDIGKAECPDGYNSIKDTMNCKAASKLLNLEYSDVDDEINKNAVCYWCGGCGLPKVGVSSTYGNNARWVCKRKGYIKQLIILLLSKH